MVKNKLAPPFRVALFEITFGKGVSKLGEIIDLGVNLDIIKKSGSWYSYNDTKIAQGKESAKQFLDDNQEVAEEITKLILDHYMPDQSTPELAEAEVVVEPEAEIEG